MLCSAFVSSSHDNKNTVLTHLTWHTGRALVLGPYRVRTLCADPDFGKIWISNFSCYTKTVSTFPALWGWIMICTQYCSLTQSKRCHFPHTAFLILTHWGPNIRHWTASSLVQLMAWRPAGRQAITRTNNVLPLGPLGTNFSENWIKIQKFSFKETYMKCRLQSVSHFVPCLKLGYIPESFKAAQYPSGPRVSCPSSNWGNLCWLIANPRLLVKDYVHYTCKFHESLPSVLLRIRAGLVCLSRTHSQNRVWVVEIFVFQL